MTFYQHNVRVKPQPHVSIRKLAAKEKGWLSLRPLINVYLISAIHFVTFRFSSRHGVAGKGKQDLRKKLWGKISSLRKYYQLGKVYRYLIFAHGGSFSKLQIVLQERSCFKYFLAGALYLQTLIGTIVIWSL